MGNSEWFGIFSESERGCAQRDSFVTTHKSDLRLCKGIGTHCIALRNTYIQLCDNKNSKQCCTCPLLKVWILREDLPLFIFKNISFCFKASEVNFLTHFNKNDKAWLCAESRLLMSTVVPSLDIFGLALLIVYDISFPLLWSFLHVYYVVLFSFLFCLYCPVLVVFLVLSSAY